MKAFGGEPERAKMAAKPPFFASCFVFSINLVCMSSSLLLPEYTEPTDFWDKCAPIALLMKDFLQLVFDFLARSPVVEQVNGSLVKMPVDLLLVCLTRIHQVFLTKGPPVRRVFFWAPIKASPRQWVPGKLSFCILKMSFCIFSIELLGFSFGSGFWFCVRKLP